MDPPRLQEIETTTEGLQVFPSVKKYSANYKGYYYVYYKGIVLGQSMRCYKHNEGCKAKLHLSGGFSHVISEDFATPDYHNHGADTSFCHRKYLNWRIKSRARASTSNTSSIISEEIENVPIECRGRFPKLPSLSRTVQRSRNNPLSVVVNASSRSEIPNLTGLFLLSSGEDFLKWDSGQGNDRILLFSTEANLDCLARVNHVFADGTFKVQPILFDQLFVIHGMRQDGSNVLCLPLVFCLTPNRTRATYRRIFQQLKELRPNLMPVSIMTDFELASQNAFLECFPNSETRSCFFHFRQCNFRHIQANPNLMDRLKVPEFSLHLRMMIALAFVPSDDVIVAFDELDASDFMQENKNVLDEYLDYFVNNWIGGFDRRGNRKSPRFAINHWNCYDAVLNDLPKTNNFCEGFHRGLLSLMSVHHPTLPRFVRGLIKKNNLSAYRLDLFVAGIFEPPKTANKLHAARLKAAVERYGQPQLTILEFLRCVAECIQFN